MALRYIAVSAAGAASETPNSQSTLATAVTDAIDVAITANGEVGLLADVTTELGLVTDALTALTANQPTGGIVVTLDTELVTTRNKLRELLDAAYNHLAASNLVT